jgi:hypothetical protein
VPGVVVKQFLNCNIEHRCIPQYRLTLLAASEVLVNGGKSTVHGAELQEQRVESCKRKEEIGEQGADVRAVSSEKKRAPIRIEIVTQREEKSAQEA